MAWDDAYSYDDLFPRPDPPPRRIEKSEPILPEKLRKIIATFLVGFCFALLATVVIGGVVGLWIFVPTLAIILSSVFGFVLWIAATIWAFGEVF